MKFINFKSLRTALCIGFIQIGALQATGVTQDNPRAELTRAEEVRIQEERLSHFPQEFLENTKLGYGATHFYDDKYFSLIHPNADQHIAYASDSGDIIELHDQSRWSVSFFSRGTVLGWVQSDLIFIKPKSSWFSSYNYELQNRTTGETASVNILSVVQPAGFSNRWIRSIDQLNKLIQLDDGSVWQVNPSEVAFKKWQIGDRLSVGVNYYWRMDSFVHVLINTTFHETNYCEANYVGESSQF